MIQDSRQTLTPQKGHRMPRHDLRQTEQPKTAVSVLHNPHTIGDLIFYNRHKSLHNPTNPHTIHSLARSQHNCLTGGQRERELEESSAVSLPARQVNKTEEVGRAQRTCASTPSSHRGHPPPSQDHSPSTLQSSQSNRNRQSPLKSQCNPSTKRGGNIELDTRGAKLFSPCLVDLLRRDSRIATKLQTHPSISFTIRTERQKTQKKHPKRAVSKLPCTNTQKEPSQCFPVQTEVHSVKQGYPRSIQPHKPQLLSDPAGTNITKLQKSQQLVLATPHGSLAVSLNLICKGSSTRMWPN